LYSTGSLSVAAIPEPGTFALVGCGLVGMTMIYRKRRAALS
jgi:threonine dehydrogenase-like Zn-dependent dehydrogenase